MVSLFFKILFIFPFQTKGQPEDELAQVFIPFYEWRNRGSVQVTPPEGPGVSSSCGCWPWHPALAKEGGGWEGEYSDKCPALSFLRMPARTSCHLVDDAHRIFYGGTCSSLKGSPVTIMCSSLAGSQEGRAEITAKPLSYSFWGKLLGGLLNLNCMFSSLSCLWSCFTAVFTSFSFAFLAPGW